jgi:hypothetical protein
MNPADISSLAINTNIVGRGPARHTRLISPVALPRPLRPPALAPGSSLLRVADTFDPITGMAEREVKYTESHTENISLRRYNRQLSD